MSPPSQFIAVPVSPEGPAPRQFQGPTGRLAADTGCDDGPVTDADARTCSARGCTAPAAWALLWNNPKLHTPERRKTWLACDEHRASLSEFLNARKFLRDVVPVTELPG